MSEFIIGNCEVTQQLKKLVNMVSVSNSTVLLEVKQDVEKML